MQIYLHICSADNLYLQIRKKALSVVLYLGGEERSARVTDCRQGETDRARKGRTVPFLRDLCHVQLIFSLIHVACKTRFCRKRSSFFCKTQNLSHWSYVSNSGIFGSDSVTDNNFKSARDRYTLSRFLFQWGKSSLWQFKVRSPKVLCSLLRD